MQDAAGGLPAAVRTRVDRLSRPEAAHGSTTCYERAALSAVPMQISSRRHENTPNGSYL